MSKFPNLQRFTRDVIHPVIVSVRYWVLSCIMVIQTLLSSLMSEISTKFIQTRNLADTYKTQILSYLSSVSSSFSVRRQNLNDNLASHIVRKDNPHKVKFSQISLISAVAPLNTQGLPGQMWLQHNAAVTYDFVIGSWSECSVPCGGGIQTREVNCVRNDGAIVSDLFCLDLGLVKPDTSQICNTQPCIIPIDVSFYVAADNRGEMFRANSSLVKGASLGGSWSTGDGVYDNVYGPNVITFTPGVPVYFCSEGYNTNDEGGGSFIFTNIEASRFTFNLLRVDAGPTPVWRNDIPWVYNPALGSRGFLRTLSNNVQWKWFFSLTLNS